MTEKFASLSTTIKYSILGALFGCLFPIIASLIDPYLHAYIIFTVPLFLGAFAYIAGFFRQKAKEEVIKSLQIQEKEKISAHVEHVFNSISDFLFVVNEDGFIITTNQSAAISLLYSIEELKLKHIKSILSPKHKHVQNFTSITDFLKSDYEQEGMEVEMTCYGKNSSKYSVLVSCSEMKDATTASKQYILSCKSLADSKIVKEVKQKQLKMMQTAKSSLIGEMATGLAHEINNPLFIAKGNLDRIYKFIEKQPNMLNEDIRQRYEATTEALNRIKTIVKYLMNNSKTSKQELQPVEVNPIIYAAYDALEEQLSQNSIVVDLILPKHSPSILADDIKLEQIIVNFFSNAKDAIINKFSGHPGGLIKCMLSTTDHSIIIILEDNGCGMDEDGKSKIFDTFYSTKKLGKGSGLGMGISHKIITEFKGNIDFDSTLGQGSKVTLEFPQINKLEKSRSISGT